VVPKTKNRTENPDINPCSYSHLIFNKGAQNIKDNLLEKYCWKISVSAYRKLKLDPCALPCTNINSKWIKDLNIRPEALYCRKE
jgi:hypothetical protein